MNANMKTYPLLQSQLGVFLQCMQHPDIMQYNLPSIVKLDSAKVDLDRLAAAVMSLYEQRRELHISFLIDENGDPRQYVNDDMKFSVVRRKMSEDEFRNYAYGGGFVRLVSRVSLSVSGDVFGRFDERRSAKLVCGWTQHFRRWRVGGRLYRAVADRGKL